MTQTRTQVYREKATNKGTYDVYIEIDTDCQDLLDAADIDYNKTEDDVTQNEICISMNEEEFIDTFKYVNLVDDDYWNEVSITEILLNPEMCEYVTKVTIYKPNGDIISFC